MKSELIEMKNRVISNDKAFDITISCLGRLPEDFNNFNGKPT